MKRWCIGVTAAAAVWAAGAAAAWLLVEDIMQTRAHVCFEPAASAIAQTQDGKPSLDGFVRTYAWRMTSSRMLNHVADELRDKNLRFFRGAADPVPLLQKALTHRIIVIESGRQANAIDLTMTGNHPREAEQIINAFVRAHESVVGGDEGRSSVLSTLDKEKQRLEQKMLAQREAMQRRADQYIVDELERTQKLYDAVRKRIDKIEMESKPPYRISAVEMAHSLPITHRKGKLTAAAGTAGILAGLLAAAVAGGRKRV